MFNKKVLIEIRQEYGLANRKSFSDGEAKAFSKMEELPDGVYEDVGAGGLPYYYQVVPTDLKPEELAELTSLTQLRYIRTIKNCLVFFVTMTVISFVAAICFTLYTYFAFRF